MNDSAMASAQRPGAGGVVRGVDEHGGAAPHDLEPARGVDGRRAPPAARRCRAAGRRRRGRPRRPPPRPRRSAPGGCRAAEGTGRGTPRRGRAARSAGHRRPRRGPVTPKSVPSNTSRAPTSLARSTSTSTASGSGWSPTTVIASALMMPAFSVAISLDRVAEEVAVVEGDRRDDRDGGVDDVRGVPRAAHPDLDDGDVDGEVGERGVRDGDEHLEVRHRRAAVDDRARVDDLDERDDLVVGGEEALGVDRPAADGDALEHRVQVGRGEPAGLQAQLAQQRLDDARGARLAVGPGDVDDGEGALRVAEQLHDGADPVERGLEVVLGGAREDRLLDLTHPAGEGELVRGVALGGIGCRAHPPILPCRPGRSVLRGDGGNPDGPGRPRGPGLVARAHALCERRSVLRLLAGVADVDGLAAVDDDRTDGDDGRRPSCCR